MKKTLLTSLLTALSLLSYADSKTVFTTDITRDASKSETSTTRFIVNLDVLCEAFGRTDIGSLETGINAKTIKIVAANPTTGKAYSSSATYGTYGFWFTAKGVPTSSTNTARTLACKYEDGYFRITHNAAKAAEGSTYAFSEMFVQGSDTVLYNFNVTLGSADKITSTNQPAFEEKLKRRADKVESWKVIPQVRINEQTPLQQNYIQVMAGEQITLGCVLPEGATNGRYTWKNRNGKALQTLKATDLVVKQATPEDAGYYVLSGRYNDAEGNVQTFSGYHYYIDVQTEELGTYWNWAGEVPALRYNFRSEYPTLEMPSKVHTFKKKNGTPANQYAGEWWSIFWGDNCNPACGDKDNQMDAAQNMVKKFDEDFAYIRNNLGWPPDLSARKGYKSFIYIFGSGLANDNEANTVDGGYQSATNTDGGYYACVWASFYPFSRFRSDADNKWNDGEFQREAMIHEGIHAIFADLNACQGSAWFHEGGNTWLQKELHAKRDGVYGEAGHLDSSPFIAPFMPIECYSGWLQDGSFGGPAAQGVNKYGNDGQVCTWRTHLGGNQYANAFPTVLAAICGDESVAWIWRYCKNRVLETIGDTIGDTAMRSLITQYRARQALFDLDGWDKSYRSITNSHFGEVIRAEYRNGVMTKANKNNPDMPCWIDVAPHTLTPYQTLTKNSLDGWYAPDTLTNPGWSGANIIPIHVEGDYAEVEFKPEDTEMRALLCYRTKEGKCFYSQPVNCGTIRINLAEKPANGVVFCVVCNTDYRYTGDEQRKKHWDYRLKLGTGALAVADNMCKWFFYENKIEDKNFDKDAAIEEKEFELGVDDIENTSGIILKSTILKAGQAIQFEGNTPKNIHIVGAAGVIVDSAPVQSNGSYTLPSNMTPGLYFICVESNRSKDVFKVIVK